MFTTPELKEKPLNKLDSRLYVNGGASFGCRGDDKGREVVGNIEKLSWKDSLAIQELLNVICQIIADEYVTVAKENPQTFTTGE